MIVRWLGQAGLFLDIAGLKVLIDPYFSNSVEKINPKNYRRIPANEEWFDLEPDVLIFTHDHLDHFDPETAERFLEKDKPMLVLSPTSVWQKARQYGGEHNYVQFNAGTEWTEQNVCFRAVYANHSDAFAIGVVICHDDKTYYISGDTLYDKRIIDEVGDDVDVAILPINGVGNNMNYVDATRLAEAIDAELLIPVHYGMFDSLDPSVLEYPNKYIAQIDVPFDTDCI